MPRPEASLEGRPQHLVVLAQMLRKARKDAGITTYKELGARTGYHATALSKAASGHRLPSLEITLAFAEGCGVDDLDEWERVWNQTKDIDEAISERDAIRAAFASITAPITVPAAAMTEPVLGLDAQPLVVFLRKAETKDQLIEAMRRVGRRAGCTSFRQLEAHTGIPHSTLNDWFKGRRRPSRLDEMVLALGATAAEHASSLSAWSVSGSASNRTSSTAHRVG